MGNSGKGSCNFDEVAEKAQRLVTDSFTKSAMAASYAYVLLDSTIPDRLLGITGQMRRNRHALQLGLDVVNKLITPEEAEEKLEMFTENLFNKSKKEKWVQLPLWNHSELDQL